MSTIDPEHGKPPADPVGGLATPQPGAPRADDHDHAGPPDPATVARGHEVDSYDAASVLSVPLLVVLFFVLAFGTVTVIFYFIAPSVDDPNAHQQAVDRNKEDLNTRMERIHRGSKDVDQPRLEPLKLRSGDSRAITRPELPTGNSPELHPEDLRPSPTNTPALYRTGPGKLTIDEAMEQALKDKKTGVLKSRETPLLPIGSDHKPTAANAGRGFAPSQVVLPKLPAEPEAKKDEPKKEQPKKDEGKKEEPKKDDGKKKEEEKK